MDRYEWIDPITKDKFAVTALESFFEDTETVRGNVYHTHACARSEILRLASGLKAKDAELTSLKAENADLMARLERAENLVRDMLDPERFGWAVTGEVRDAARAVLGIAPCEALKERR